MKELYLLVRNDVKAVTGHNRGLIMDFNTGAYYFCPLTLCDFVITHNTRRIDEIMLSYTEEESSTVTAYIDWLLRHQLAVLSKSSNFISNITFEEHVWDSPYSITNCILEVNQSTLTIFDFIIDKLDKHGIPHLELRIFDAIDIDGLKLLLNKIQDSDIKTVSVFCKYSETHLIPQLRKKFKFLTVIESITIFDAPYSKVSRIHDGITTVHYIKDTISTKCCGNIKTASFRVNRTLFAESLRFNTCLNRKISIGADGAIKNCPSMPHSFGNLLEDDIGLVTSGNAFKKLWTIAKDDIKVCKDCEFRHVCTDCRAYKQDPTDEYSKPLKCGYNPYTNEWAEWSSNPLSKGGITYYGL